MASRFRKHGISKGYCNSAGNTLLSDNFDPRTMQDHLEREFTPEKMHSREIVILANQLAASKRVGLKKDEVLALVEQVFIGDAQVEENQ